MDRPASPSRYVLACGPAATCAAAARRLRRRARQPVPRLRPARPARRRLPARRPPCTTRSPSTASSSWPPRTDPARRLTLRRWYGFTRMQTPGRPAAAARSSPSPARPRQEIVEHLGVRAGPRSHVVPDRRRHRPLLARPRGRRGSRAGSSPPPAPTCRSRACVHLVEALAKVRTEHPRAHLVVVGKPQADGGPVAAPSSGSAWPAPSSFVSGITDAGAGRPDAAAPRSPACPRCTRASRCPPSRRWPAAPRWWPPPAAPSPRSPARTARRAWPCRPATRARWPRPLGRLLDDPALRARLGAAGRARVLARFTWERAADRHRERYRAAIARRRARRGAARAARRRRTYFARPRRTRTRMQTPRADRRLRRASRSPPGDRVLDLGCGGGPARLRVLPARRRRRRPGPERRRDRRGRRVVRRHAAGRRGPGRRDRGRDARATRSACRSPTAPSTGHRLRGDGAHPGRQARDRRDGPRAEARRPARGHRAALAGPEKVCWALSDAYHEVEGGHIRIYRRRRAAGAGSARPACARTAATTRTRCTRRTGGSSARSASTTTRRRR